MRLLALAVAAFAAAALFVALKQSDTLPYLLALSAAACAVVVYASSGLSNFLRIFETVFAVETILFGSAFLAHSLGYWPEAYENYAISDTLPIAVGVFAVVIFTISFIPVMRRMTAIADPYFSDDALTTSRWRPFPAFQVRQNRLAIAGLVFLILINQFEVALDVRLSYFHNDFLNAMKNLDQPEFWRQLLLVFIPVVTAYTIARVTEYVVTTTFKLRWRRWLTGRYLTRWMAPGVHYTMALAGGGADNPDQRIAEDVGRFIDGLYSNAIVALQNLTSIVSFSIILWTLSSGFSVFGITLPGALFWVAVVYSATGTIVAHAIGHPLSKLNFSQQQKEADFRFGLARDREYGEQIALLHGEHAEVELARGNFARVYENMMRIIGLRKFLAAYTYSYLQASVVIPRIVGAPLFFSGKLSLGGFQQVTSAFNNVNENMNFFVTNYTDLADYKATLDRLSSFDGAIEKARSGASTSGFTRSTAADGALALSNASVTLPDGRPLVTVPDLKLRPLEPTLVVGASGTGKSTLFRAISGIWPFANGTLALPSGKVMTLPQRPYVPNGPLRVALAYPGDPAAFTASQMSAALIDAGLPALADKLDESDVWQRRLSGGELQRLSVARAMLAAPDWLLLDEATAALDEASEAAIYRKLAERLPSATLVSIGHRASLEQFHRRRVAFQPVANGPAVVSDA